MKFRPFFHLDWQENRFFLHRVLDYGEIINDSKDMIPVRCSLCVEQ